jgi:adenine-specific DNA-methyltransferase
MLKTEQYREQLIVKLRQMFMMDQDDLDFGIYRIMNAKRDEVENFLTNDLLPTLRKSLEAFQPDEFFELNKELKEIAKSPAKFSREYAEEVKSKLEAAQDVSKLEEEVYSHLLTFFSRYYDGGDFMSLRRYKDETYSPLPFNGEEVKLHWANADQYYIKSAEKFRTYAFKTQKGRVRFELATATTERDNNKAIAEKERRFILSAEDTLQDRDGELIIHFEYRADEKKRNQKQLNILALSSLLEMSEGSPLTQELKDWLSWQKSLSEKVPTEKNSNRTLLEKHLNDYTAKNSFDYFIHKDLGSFLRRELDFFIKNEVMHLDDIENETVPKVEQYLAKIKAMRQIAHKIIDFLAQLENFQKKLWLKKKFILEENWLITLDKIPEELYPEIVDQAEIPVTTWNGITISQREEWVKLFAIDEIKGDLSGSVKYSEPLTVDFLKQNLFLVLDTAFFDQKLKDKLLMCFDDIYEVTDGLLIQGENFQALNLLSSKEKLDIIYIDPPFNLNTNADFIYKTNYLNSSWITLLINRFKLAINLLNDNGLIFVRCDYHGSQFVRNLLEELNLVFKSEIYLDRSRNEAGSPNKMEVTIEHLFMFAKKDISIDKYTIQRSVANIKWTGFLMAGERKPPERKFLGKTFLPPKGQHWSLIQPKVDRILKEFHLRLRCKECSCLYFHCESDEVLFKEMKKTSNKFKFYDVLPTTNIHGVVSIENCLECDAGEFRVDYLGSAEVYINDRWLDIPSYSRRWNFSTENSEELLERVMKFKGGSIIDYFGGSGTTAATAQKMGRKWVLAEMGDYFDTVTMTRIKQVLNGEKSGISNKYNWSGGGVVKYLRLESYEDATDNLDIKRTEPQQQLIESNPILKEDYMLSYMLDVESHESLMNLEQFIDPFNVKMNITRDDETREVKVKMLETFNYLLGIRVKTLRKTEDVYEVIGKLPNGEHTLILWRNVIEINNDALDEWFKKQAYSSRDIEFDVIYVNGDNNIENFRKANETWKVRLIEEVFHRLMFEIQDV